MITNSQKGRIHKLTAELGWSRETYVRWLEGRFGVKSSLELESDTAREAIRELTEMVEALREESKATTAQISYIKYLWIGVDYAACNQGDKLLNSFLQRKYGVEHVEELTRGQASGAIAAIKRMQFNLQKRKGGISVGRLMVDPVTGNGCAWVTLEDGSRALMQFNDEILQ